jgi:hypothetical protein
MNKKMGKCIGKGSFSTVYKHPSKQKKVLIVSSDKAKEAIADEIAYSDMLPKIKKIGFASDNEADCRRLYESIYYDKVRAPKQQLSKKAYQQYVQLRKAVDNIKQPLNIYDSYNRVYTAFEKIKDKNLREEMISILDGFSNYGSDVSFEISPRNIAIGNYKSLVLLDCFFFREDLLKVLDKKLY